MEKLGILLLVVCILAGHWILEVKCQSPSLQDVYSTSACHGSYSVETTVNANCSDGNVVAIKSISTGSKLMSVGCPSNYNSSFDFSTCCTKDQTNDCIYPLYSENYIYHTDCGGKQACQKETQNQKTAVSCTQGTFTESSRYMFMEYYCIEDDKMVEICSTATSTLTRENTEVYIWNKNFGGAAIDPSDTSCNCSVEIDNCNAGINIYKMLRILTGNGPDTCNQTVRVGSGENSSVLFEWNCDDNKQAIENYMVQDTYILVNLENSRNESKVWLGFEATADSNITVSCPPKSQQHCSQTTTSTTVTTTDVTTVTTSTTTDNSTSTTTTTTTTEPSTSSTTMSTTAKAQNETSEVVMDTSNDKYLAAVIALAVLSVVFLIVIIILSSCLYLRCRTKDKSDEEKFLVKKTPFHEEPVAEAKPALPSGLSFVDFGCQVHIDKVYDYDYATHDDTKQKSETLVERNCAEMADIGCQVSLSESKIVHDLNLSEEKSTQTQETPIKQKDKCVTTVPISLSNGQCQTDVIKKKSQKTQVNFKTKSKCISTSSQTENIPQDDTKQEKVTQEEVKHDDVEQTIVSNEISIVPVANGNIPTFQNGDETMQRNINNTALRHRRKKKKKKIVRSDDERYSLNISPYSEESPASKRFLFTPEPETFRRETEIEKPETEKQSDSNSETNAEGPDAYNREVRPINVRPASPINTETRHVYKVRNVMASAFFSKERYEENMIRTINRQSKKKRIEKRKDLSHSKC